MHVRFADVDENFIKTEVQSGFYTNETELVRDAVRRMREGRTGKALSGCCCQRYSGNRPWRDRWGHPEFTARD